MLNWLILAILVCVVSIWLYSSYVDFMTERREKKAIAKALKDTGYV